MNSFLQNKVYKLIVYGVVLIPNLFAIFIGIESFPFTCAPMFTHHIDENTPLYLFKFEGVNNKGEVLDLKEYYGRRERDFMRDFFGKAYGVTSGINPANNLLVEDSKVEFENRMNLFFQYFTKFLSKEYNMSFKQVVLSIKKVDRHRNELSNYELVGLYNVSNKQYSYGSTLSEKNN